MGELLAMGTFIFISAILIIPMLFLTERVKRNMDK